MPRRIAPREIALIQLLPNAMTLGAICAGVTAMRMAVAGEFGLAVALLVAAAVLDGLDGRVARVLQSESLIGAELDSLADVVNFGVAPAIILYFWTLAQSSGLGWLAALAYIVCCALRLARFNVGAKTGEAGDPRFFTGVPSPAGALLALGPLILAHAVPQLPPIPPWAAALWLILTGVLMVTRLPTVSLKLRIPAARARLALAGLAGAVVLLAVYPWSMLLAFDLAYLASIPLALRLARPRKE